MSEQVRLRPVDAADVTILIDNAIDVLVPSTEVAQRPPLAWDWSERDPLRAEHGYALALTVEIDGRRESILYDAGLGRDSVAHNLEVLGLKPAEFRAMVLSHGHADHHGGLEGLFRRVGRRAMPLVLHPDAWRDRRVVFPTGVEIHLPPPSRQDLDREGWEIVEERAPTLLLEGAVLVTGQIERETDFEQGFPIHHARSQDGGWELDRWIWDDQAVVVHVRDKGLVVLSSCSHSGANNVLRHARRLTGVDQVYAFVGGMHLTGGLFEPIIGRTVEEMAAIGPSVAARLPGAYIQSNVGTRLHFAAAPVEGTHP